MPRKHKYSAKKCVYDGLKFDSILERNRYIFLKNEQANGNITELETQVVLPIYVFDQLVCKAIPDFKYRYKGEYVYEDTKGVITDYFRLKLKLVKATHGIDIRVVKSPTEPL